VNLSEPFIRRPVMTVLLTVSAILFGALAYRAMPVNNLPAVDYPVIQVNCSYPGATPETMANNVATPLERQFTQIPGLEVVTSSSSQGQSSFTLQFNLNKSIDAAATDVQTAITQANGQLPTDLPSPPTFSKTNPNDQPIMYIALATSSVTRGQLYDYASTQAGERISILPGVSKIQIYGTPSAVRIKADPSKLATRNMTMDTLAAAIKNGTSYQGSGQFDGPNRTFLLQPQGQLDNAEGYNNLVIGYQNHAPVFLKDVATAEDSVQDERIDLRFWARQLKEIPTATVVVAVFRQAGTNAVEVAQSVEKLIPTIQKTLPNSVQMRTIYDQSKSIVDSVGDVESTLIIAFVLVVLVIFMFLGRAADTLIPVVALPLSMLITFIAMNALGYSLDNLSLMALTLAIGFLVDDAIVFLENCVRRMEKYGESPGVAALHGAKEISFTILSMTVSLAAVFLPLVLLSGLMGRIFREFSITIIISIFASGIVSLTLTPLMCARLLAARGHGVKKTWLERVIGGIEQRVLAVYGNSLWFFLHHKWISAITWVICLLGTFVLFQMVPKSFLPVGDSSFMFGVMIAQQGTSPAQMKQYQDKATAIMQANPDVLGTVTVTSVGGGLLGSNQGFLIAFLNDPKERHPYQPDPHMPFPGLPKEPQKHASIQTIGTQMQFGIMGTNPGLLAFMIPQPVLSISTGAASRTQGDLQFAISGVDPAQVYDTSNKLFGAFATSKEAQQIFLPMALGGISNDLSNQPAYNNPNLKIDILRDEAASYHISATRIETLLKNAYSQNYVYLIKRPTNQYQVILEAKDKDRTEPDDLSKLYITSDDGSKTVPLSAVAKWTQVLGPQSVNHLNQFTSVTFSFNLLPGVPLGTATDFIKKTADAVVPSTMRADFQGQALTFRETVSSLSILMVLAVFVMYVILGILYESYLHPITVLSSLPVALVGGLGTLVLFHQEASLYAYIGMFMLMGIVKKNGIMIVDFALQRIGQGETAEQAIHDASMDRFRPIIMTTLAAIMGAVPIALGFGADGEGRRPLGLVIIGGLIVSQFITLYVTPAIYLYLENFQEHVLDRTSFFRSSRLQHEHDARALCEEPADGEDASLVTATSNGNNH
jgi:HAE1 family hydrophobic/amphiphilic exporter-1